MARADVRYSHRTGIRITPEQRDDLAELATWRGLDVADLIREGIDIVIHNGHRERARDIRFRAARGPSVDGG